MNKPVIIKINNLQSSKVISSFSWGKSSNSLINSKLFKIVFQAQINKCCSLYKKLSDSKALLVYG